MRKESELELFAEEMMRHMARELKRKGYPKTAVMLSIKGEDEPLVVYTNLGSEHTVWLAKNALRTVTPPSFWKWLKNAGRPGNTIHTTYDVDKKHE